MDTWVMFFIQDLKDVDAGTRAVAAGWGRWVDSNYPSMNMAVSESSDNSDLQASCSYWDSQSLDPTTEPITQASYSEGL